MWSNAPIKSEHATGLSIELLLLKRRPSVAIGAALAEHRSLQYCAPKPQRIGRGDLLTASLTSHLKLSSVCSCRFVLGQPVDFDVYRLSHSGQCAHLKGRLCRVAESQVRGILETVMCRHRRIATTGRCPATKTPFTGRFRILCTSSTRSEVQPSQSVRTNYIQFFSGQVED